ncbi:MAG: hypothetical protein VKM34_06070 [Cyanobacteriota bacterium]|nr:hypothetical protein [Cyanobacteriota bacterium]
MHTQRCQTCTYWDQGHGLEMTNLGAIAPCTRHAPAHFAVKAVSLTAAGLTFGPNHTTAVLTEMELPVAVWPYTGHNQICGEYHPCDLDETVRRNRLRAAPLS